MILNLKVVFDSVWCINQNSFKDSRFLHLISFLTPDSSCSILIVTFSFTNNIKWDEVKRIKNVVFTIFHSFNWLKKKEESSLFQSEMWSVSPTSQPCKKLKINLTNWLRYQRLPKKKRIFFFSLKNEEYSLDIYLNSLQSSWNFQIDWWKTNVLFVVFFLLSSSYFIRE